MEKEMEREKNIKIWRWIFKRYRLKGIEYNVSHIIKYERKVEEEFIKEYYPDGKMKFEGKYLNNGKNGIRKEYYPNGKLESEEEYLNGKKMENVKVIMFGMN